jgi:UDP-N-acetylglucosamine enolpyruvyl transferase
MYFPQQVTKTIYWPLTEQQCFIVSKLIVNGQVTVDEMTQSGIKASSPVISQLRSMGVEIITIPASYTIDAKGHKHYLTPLTYTVDGEHLYEGISYDE